MYRIFNQSASKKVVSLLEKKLDDSPGMFG